jgi:NADH-quinone oxidoreductase subunit N
MQIQSGMSDVMMVLPLIILFFASLVPVTVKVLFGNKEQPHFATLAQGLLGVIVAICLVLWQWNNIPTLAFSQALVFDGISSWANLLTLLITGGSLLLMHDNLHTRDHQFAEQVSLVLSSAVGMMIIAWSNDLIVTFIGIELMSLSTYVVIGLGLEQKLSKEAAFKYFVLGSFASAVLLYGIALIYGTAETTLLSRLAETAPALMASNKLFLIGMILLVSGAAFKISIVPFHAWTPDVYQGAPTPITAFMATGVKIVMFAFFIRLALTGVMTGSESMVDVLEWMAAITILLGNLAALKQTNMKRMLAYSSVAHSGYILIGIIAAAISKAPAKSISSVIFYLVTYSIMTLGTFGLVSLYEKTEKSVLYVYDLKGLAHRRPRLAFGLTVLLLSLAGIPPLAGFFGKLFLFSTAVAEGLFWPVVWGVIGSVVGVVYYLRPVVNMYMFEPDEYYEEPSKHVFTRVALAAAVALVIIVGIASNPILNMVKASVESLFT